MPKYVSNLRLFFSSSYEGPKDHIKEITAIGLPAAGPHIFIGGAVYVWLAPIYADAARPAASSINLVVQQTRDPNHGEFARNASGDYCYLVPTVGGDVKIYDLALYRTTVRIEDELPLGFDGCSEDLETEPWMDGHVYTVSDDGEEEGEYEYLYLVWKTHLA